jgi:hypothetical protein
VKELVKICWRESEVETIGNEIDSRLLHKYGQERLNGTEIQWRGNLLGTDCLQLHARISTASGEGWESSPMNEVFDLLLSMKDDEVLVERIRPVIHTSPPVRDAEDSLITRPIGYKPSPEPDQKVTHLAFDAYFYDDIKFIIEELINNGVEESDQLIAIEKLMSRNKEGSTDFEVRYRLTLDGEWVGKTRPINLDLTLEGFDATTHEPVLNFQIHLSDGRFKQNKQ